MFERYSEEARRAIFFARYEASQLGSDFITLESLLFGLLRENQPLLTALGPEGVQAVRDYVIEHGPPVQKSYSTSVDVPLDSACKDALNRAMQEADLLKQRGIWTTHLVLALLRAEGTLAAEALRTRGIDYKSYRDMVTKLPPGEPGGPRVGFDLRSAVQPRPIPEIEASAPALRAICHAFAGFVGKSATELDKYGEAEALHPLGPSNWLRKEALGHLIDCACTHQQWFARALSEPRLNALSYPEREWTTAQCYRAAAWADLTHAWAGLNRLLIHVMAQVPEAKLVTPCRIGLADSIPLERLIENYVKHVEDEMAEILKRR